MKTGCLTLYMVETFRGLFRAVLGHKLFFNANDRSEVQNIVEGFLMKRLLADAVMQNNPNYILDFMQSLMSTSSIRNVLDHPVDSEGNTLLHLAVRCNFPAVVEALLESGADCTIRNLHGDLPTEVWMFPN